MAWIIKVKKNFFFFFFILICASFFRLTNLHLIEFKADEAINLLLSSRPIFGYPLTPGGTVSSLGILNPPFFNYLLLPFTAFSLDPKFISFLIGLANSLAIAFLFLIIKRFYGFTIAFISTILLSFSPWAIIYSRKIWMQDLLIPFFVVLFFSIHKLVVEKKQIFWLPYASCSFFLTQLHPISFLFIALITLFLFLQKIKINFKYIALGLLIGLLPLIPYIAYEFANNCPDCESFIRAQNKFSFRYSPELFFRPLQILSQGNFRFILGNDTLTFAQNFPFVDALRRVFYFEYLLIPIGIVIFLKKFKNLKFLAYATIALPFAYFILKLEPFMHYYIIAVPFLFLFLAVVFDFFIFNKNLLLKSGSRFLLLAIIIESLAFNSAFFELLNSKGSLQGDFGSTFFVTESQKRKELKEFEGNSDYNEIFLSSFIPLNYVYGYQALGKILYSSTNYEEVLTLENELKEGSKDPRVEQKILSFYTKSKPTLETIDLLRKKNSNIPRYQKIYREVLADFLATNFKKEYIYHEGGFRFFYPEHWKIEETKGRLILSGDGYSLSIEKDRSVNFKYKTKAIDDIVKSIRFL